MGAYFGLQTAGLTRINAKLMRINAEFLHSPAPGVNSRIRVNSRINVGKTEIRVNSRKFANLRRKNGNEMLSFWTLSETVLFF